MSRPAKKAAPVAATALPSLARENKMEALRRTAAVISGELGIQVVFAGNIAYTDFKRIVVPSLPDNAPDDLVEAITGYLDHEIGHILFTDREEKRPFDDPDPRVQSLTNAIEDVRQEHLTAQLYRGMGVNLERSLIWSIGKVMSAWDGIRPWSKFCIMMMAWHRATVGMLPQAKDMLRELDEGGESLDLVKHFAGRIEKWHTLPSTAAAYEECKTILAEIDGLSPPSLSPLPPPPPPPSGESPDGDGGDGIEEKKEKGKSKGKKKPKDKEQKDDSSDGGDQADDERGDGGEGGPGLQDNDGKDDQGNDGDGQGDGDRDEGECSGDNQGGDGGNDDNDNDGEGEGEGKSGNQGDDDDDSGLNLDPDAPGLRSLAEKLSAKMVKSRDDQNATFHQVMKVNIARDSANVEGHRAYTEEFDLTIPPSGKATSEDYHKIFEEVRPYVNVISGVLARTLMSRANSTTLRGRYSGAVSANAVSQLRSGQSNIFQVRQEGIALDTYVELVVDHSGSMHSGGKIRMAQKTCIAIAESLAKIGVPFGVCGFTDGFVDECEVVDKDLYRRAQEYLSDMARGIRSGVASKFSDFHRLSPLVEYVYKTPETPFSRMKINMALMTLQEMNANADGDSIYRIAKRVAKRRERRKVIIVMSDGEPATYQGNNVPENAAESHLRNVVKLISDTPGMEIIGIGICSEEVKQYYRRFAIVNSVNDLPVVAMGELRRALMGQ